MAKIVHKRGPKVQLRMTVQKPCREIIKHLFEIAVERDLSIQSVAEVSGVPYISIMRWNRDGVSPKLTNFLDVAEAMGLKVILMADMQEAGRHDATGSLL